MDTLWQQYDMEQKIRKVLSDPKFDTDPPERHPFLTPYQIAIALEECHPTLCDQLGKAFGGKGTGKHDSFVQYIANQLGRAIERKALPDIEIAFLANTYLNELSYRRSQDAPVESSNAGREHLSLYRMRQS